MTKNLTAVAVQNLKPGPTRREVPDGKGLFVIVQPSGRKSFALRYRVNGVSKKLTLPRGISLAQARAAAAAALVEVEKGSDPGAVKRRNKQAAQIAAANTFRAIAENYLERESRKKEGERLRSLKWKRRLLERLVFPTLGAVPINEIKRSHVIGLLDRIEDGKLVNDKGKKIAGGAVMAHSTLGAIRKIMNWHAIRDEDFKTPIVPGMSRIKPIERARSRVLSDDELRAVWKATDVRGGPFAALVRFLLLTASRRNEAAAMRWDEIQSGDWLLPAARNKVKVDLVRPLSKAALAVIEAQPRIEGCPYIFATGRKPITTYGRCKRDFDAASGVSGWVLHDLRRSARTLMSRAGVNSDVAEQCLGHLLGGMKRTYNRDDFKPQKKIAFEALASEIERIVNPPTDNVTQMRRG